MADSAIPNARGVRTAEIIAAISMTTDLAVCFHWSTAYEAP
jgi:hypothetical protein